MRTKFAPSKSLSTCVIKELDKISEQKTVIHSRKFISHSKTKKAISPLYYFGKAFGLKFNPQKHSSKVEQKVKSNAM